MYELIGFAKQRIEGLAGAPSSAGISTAGKSSNEHQTINAARRGKKGLHTMYDHAVGSAMSDQRWAHLIEQLRILYVFWHLLEHAQRFVKIHRQADPGQIFTDHLLHGLHRQGVTVGVLVETRTLRMLHKLTLFSCCAGLGSRSLRAVIASFLHIKTYY